MRVRLTAGARSDLAAIGDYIALDNRARAVSFLDELEARCYELTDAPERGAPLEGR